MYPVTRLSITQKSRMLVARAVAVVALAAVLIMATLATGVRRASALNHPAFFNGEAALSNGYYYLNFSDGTPFGYYSYDFFPFLFHIDLEFEYFIDAGNPANNAFMYDFLLNNWLYTDPATFPYLFDFTANAWYYYFPNSNSPGHYTTNPRIFVNLATDQFIYSPPTPTPSGNVLTWHNDLARTGQNLGETTLTPSNVNASQFGKLMTLPTDGNVYAQPLYVSQVNIGASVHNMLFVGSENDTAYGFDADTGNVIWQTSLLGAGETPGDKQQCTITPVVGITGTPVIVLSAGPHGTIYFVAESKNGSSYIQRIHALDITTGAEEFGGPTTVEATYPGTGDSSSNGTLTFLPSQYYERAGLVALNGNIYTFWSAHCDDNFNPLWTGWIIAYNQNTLQQSTVLNVTPNGSQGSMWQGGAAPSVDSSGNIFVAVANGTFDTTLDANGFPVNKDFGNSFIKLSTASGLSISDYWAPFNTAQLTNTDTDLGSGGLVLLPDMTDSQSNIRHLAAGVGKDGNIYVVDRDNMGKFHSSSNATLYEQLTTPLGAGGFYSTPVYFNNTMYYSPATGPISALPISSALISSTPSSSTTTSFVYPGPTPSLSANGASNAILWAIGNGFPAVLHAYNANNLSQELYNSTQASNNRDNFGNGVSFAVPTIANGKVYAGTQNGVGVFGLLQ